VIILEYYQKKKEEYLNVDLEMIVKKKVNYFEQHAELIERNKNDGIINQKIAAMLRNPKKK